MRKCYKNGVQNSHKKESRNGVEMFEFNFNTFRPWPAILDFYFDFCFFFSVFLLLLVACGGCRVKNQIQNLAGLKNSSHPMDSL